MQTDSTTSELAGPEDPAELQSRTIQWYDEHARAYADRTWPADLSAIRARFLENVRPDGQILDIGCGSGRDVAAFHEQGYAVTAIDASERMAEVAAERTGQNIICCRVQDFEPDEAFDGIWASASLLHLSPAELPPVMEAIAGWLQEGGALYLSMKEGEGERVQNDRYFHDVSAAETRHLVRQTPGLELRQLWIGDDETRDDLHWVNVVATKHRVE